jgi:hypothetical protein
MNTTFPYYKKTVWLSMLLPLISYGCFTPQERIFITKQQAETQAIIDGLTMKLIQSIEQKLNCDQLEAMAIIQAVDRQQSLEKREAAAFELAQIENRQPPRNIILEQHTYWLNARLEREAFDAAAFEKKYGVKFTGEWTIEHTMAITDLQPAVDEFIFSESNNKKIADEAEPTAGEHSPDSESA